MNDNQLVSICIPVYNGALYIEETLRSLIKQTYENIEIIVSDNASTDNTGEIIKMFCEKDPRIKYFRNDFNLGYCGNIKSAVNKATSDFIAIYHADDLYEPEIIKKQLTVLSLDNSISGVFVKMYQYYPDRKHVKPAIYNELIKSSLMNKGTNLITGYYKDFYPWILKLGNFFVCPSFMTRKSIYLKVGGFNDAYPSNEDLHLWVRYLQDGFKLAIINEFLLNYRISNNNGSAFWSKSMELPVMYNVIDDLILSNKNAETEETMMFYHKRKSKSYLFAGYNAYTQKNYEKMLENLEKSVETYNYPLLSMYGISQRFFKITCYIKSKM